MCWTCGRAAEEGVPRARRRSGFERHHLVGETVRPGVGLDTDGGSAHANQRLGDRDDGQLIHRCGSSPVSTMPSPVGVTTRPA